MARPSLLKLAQQVAAVDDVHFVSIGGGLYDE